MELTIVQKIAVSAIPLIFAITLHEVAHGWVALWCGDHTAKFAGRLSLNPIQHIDIMGTIVVPLLMLVTAGFMFGWAKPVPIDARNMKNPRRDVALVALAGPFSNMLMAIFWGAVLWQAFIMMDGGNMWLGKPLVYMGQMGIMVNIVLAALNLLPLPPLDGGRVLVALLPPRLGYQVSLLEPYGFIILILLMVSGLLSFLLGPMIHFCLGIVRSIYGF